MHHDLHQERRVAATAISTTRGIVPAPVTKAVAGRGAVSAQHAAALPSSWVDQDLGLLGHTGRSLLLAHGHERTVDSGTVLARAGDPVSEILVVSRGELELKARVDGARVTAGVLRTGGVFADIPFLIGAPTSYDAIASRETDVIAVSGAMWTQLMASSPPLALRWMTSIARRLDEDRRRLVVITSRPLIAQIAYLLVSMCESDDDGAPVVRLSHSTIAQLLGARRQSVTRTVSVLRNEGLIQTTYGAILLVDPPGLRRLMGGDPLP